MNKLFVSLIMLLGLVVNLAAMEPEKSTCTWDEAEMSLINRNEQQHELVVLGGPCPLEIRPNRIEVAKVLYNIRCSKHAPGEFNGVSKFFDKNGKVVYCGADYSFDPRCEGRQIFALGAYRLIEGHTVTNDGCTIL